MNTLKTFKPASIVEIVTPEKAAQYLGANTGNRNVMTSRVKELSGIISRGEWVVTHQGIAFSSDGRLIDGQHRLLACIDANMPIEIMVTRNVSTDAFKAMDLHGKRTYADIFGISNNLAACYNFIAQAIYGEKGVSPERIQMVIGTELGRTCAMVCHGGAHNSPIVRTSWIVGCAVHCVNGNRDYAFSLYEDIRLCNLENIPPIGAAFLRQHMNGMKVGSGANARREAFARAMVLFDPKKKNNGIIKAMSLDAALQILRDSVPELTK